MEYFRISPSVPSLITKYSYPFIHTAGPTTTHLQLSSPNHNPAYQKYAPSTPPSPSSSRSSLTCTSQPSTSQRNGNQKHHLAASPAPATRPEATGKTPPTKSDITTLCEKAFNQTNAFFNAIAQTKSPGPDPRHAGTGYRRMFNMRTHQPHS